MAKKKYISTPTPTPTAIPEDPKAEVVRDLRSKGFDDNRIAAILMMNKEKVQKIK